MDLSPIQLVNLRFLKVLVEPTESIEIETPHPRNESPFDFSGVQFQSELGHGYGETVAPTDNESGEKVEIQPYIVTLAVRLLGTEGKVAPYRIDIKCVGYFNVLTEIFPEEARRQNIVVVNGAAVVYSAIREMVSNITARSWHGELLLPAMNFLGEAPNKLDQ